MLMHPKSKKNIDFEFNIQQNWQFHTKKANGKMISTQGNTHNINHIEIATNRHLIWC